MLHDSGLPEFWMGACNPLLRLRYPTRPQPACTLGSWTTLTYREKPIPKLAKRKRRGFRQLHHPKRQPSKYQLIIWPGPFSTPCQIEPTISGPFVPTSDL